jgi:predicted permease
MEGRAFPGVCAMKLFLKLLFGGIFLWMTVMTIRTSLAMSLWQAWPTYAANPWAVATLWDAYFGFLTFYVWVVYKERKIWARMLWFLLIMGLGNIAMSLYVLIQLMRLRGDESAETILWRRAQ